MTENKNKLFESTGYLVLGASFFTSLALYVYLSKEFKWSLFAAVNTAALVWGTYIVIRMIVLASRE